MFMRTNVVRFNLFAVVDRIDGARDTISGLLGRAILNHVCLGHHGRAVRLCGLWCSERGVSDQVENVHFRYPLKGAPTGARYISRDLLFSDQRERPVCHVVQAQRVRLHKGMRPIDDRESGLARALDYTQRGQKTARPHGARAL